MFILYSFCFFHEIYIYNELYGQTGIFILKLIIRFYFIYKNYFEMLWYEVFTPVYFANKSSCLALNWITSPAASAKAPLGSFHRQKTLPSIFILSSFACLGGNDNFFSPWIKFSSKYFSFFSTHLYQSP